MLPISRLREANPEDHSGFASKLTYSYVNNLVKKARKPGLSSDDIPKVTRKVSSEFICEKLRTTLSSESRNGILWSYCRGYWLKYTLLSISLCIVKAMRVTEAILVKKLLVAMKTSKMLANVFNISIFGLRFFYAFSYIFAAFELQKMGISLRVYTWNRVFLKLLNSNFKQKSYNRIFNMISNESNVIDRSFYYSALLVIVPLIIGVTLGTCYAIMGSIGLIAVSFIFLIGSLSPLIGRLVNHIVLKIGYKSDIRTKEVANFVSSIDTLKSTALDNIMVKIIESLRRKELRLILLLTMILSPIPACRNILSRFGILIVIIVFHNAYSRLPSSASIFSLISATRELDIGLLNDSQNAFASINKLLAFDSRIKPIIYKEAIEKKFHRLQSEIKYSLEMKAVCAAWDDNEKYIFDLTVSKNEFVVITGENGNGKTSLILCILGEMPRLEGSISVNGTVSYVAQKPWLFPGTIRENILFGTDFDALKYKRVLTACCLNKDLRQFVHRDMTFVGQSGMELSGGQATRISMARALYKDSDIYLLDDPFESMDRATSKKVFERYVLGFLKTKTVIMATHGVQYITQANSIYKLTKERNLERVGKYIHSIRTDEKQTENEYQTSFNEVKKAEDEDQLSIESIDPGYKEIPTSISIQQRRINRTTIPRYILMAALNIPLAIVFFVFYGSVQALITYGDVFLSEWLSSDSSTVSNNESEMNSWRIYLILIGVGSISALIRQILTKSMCLNASRRLHKRSIYLLNCMNIDYFTSENIQTAMKRFSSDVGILDVQIPQIMEKTLNAFCISIAMAIYVSIINPISLTVTAPFFIFVGFFQYLYLTCAKQVSSIENQARTAIINEVNTVINGATDIRSYDMENKVLEGFKKLVDTHTSSAIALLSVTKWCQLRMELVSSLIVFLFSIIIIALPNSSPSQAALSLVYANSLTRAFKFALAAATNAVNKLVSFEQMADFLTLKPNENELSEKESVDPSWPTDGDLHVEKVSFKYSLNKEYVLRNISFNVSPRSKLAIVGRTGSGKSSILNMIERMGIVEGIVILDGVDTSLLNLRELRRKICIIPQKPIFISGTLRDNLDTFKEVSDEYIWTILKSVQMDEVIKRIVGEEGLDGFVRGSGFGERFSFGQLQLLSMARAIIRKRKLVIMDEATSNLEAETEKIIQRVIRHEFSECTVITIAHHIKTIIDYDDVMVIDEGRIVEIGNPVELAMNKASRFRMLVIEDGLRPERLYQSF